MCNCPGGHREPHDNIQELKASLAVININVHESSTVPNVEHYVVCGRVARKPLLSRKHIADHLQLAESHMVKVEGYWNDILWTEETMA